jgi:hypothetical protein
MKRLSCALALVVCCATTYAQGGENEPRLSLPEYVKRVQDSIQLLGSLKEEGDGGAAVQFARDLVAELAPEMVHGELIGRTEKSLTDLVDGPIYLEFSDQEYVRLRVKSHMMEQVVVNESQRNVPIVAPEESKIIRDQIQATLDEVKPILIQKLSAHYSAAEIESRVSELTSMLVARANDPSDMAFKKVDRANDLDTHLEEFTTQLEQSLPRMPERLQEPTGDTFPEDKNEYMAIQRREVLNEVLFPVVEIMFDHMTDKELLVKDFTYVAPGFKEVAMAFGEIESRLTSERERARRERQQKEMEEKQGLVFPSEKDFLTIQAGELETK